MIEAEVHAVTLPAEASLNIRQSFPMTERAQAAGNYEPFTEQFMREFLRGGDIAVDVGAHVGHFTKIMKECVGDKGTVFAFEPDSDNFENLRALDQLGSRIHVHKAAVGEERGMVNLYKNFDNDGGHALWLPALHPFNERTRLQNASYSVVPMTTLDSELLGARLVKIDVEGCEAKVLKGAARLLSTRAIDAVILEINDFALEQMGSSERAIRELMRHHGYACFLLEQWPPKPLANDERYNSPYVYNLLFVAKELPKSNDAAVPPMMQETRCVKCSKPHNFVGGYGRCQTCHEARTHCPECGQIVPD